MDAIYKFVLIGLASALSVQGQSNLTAPVRVFPPAATDPACIQLREQLSNGTDFMAFCPQNSIATSYTFQIPKWDFAGAGTNSTNSYVITRAFYLGDKTGTNTGALWEMAAEAQPSVGPQNLTIYDPGGASVLTFTRYFLGIQNYATFSGDIRATTDNAQDFGTNTTNWKTLNIRTIQSNLTHVDVNDDLKVTGNLLPDANATRDIGTSILNYNNANIRTIVSDQTTVVIGQSLTVNGAFIIPQTDNTTDLGLASPARYFKDILFKGVLNQGGVTRLDAAGNLTVTSCTGCGGGGSPPFSDATAILKDNGDPTKLLAFELSGLTTATTRTLIPQNSTYTIAGIDIAQTFTATQSFSDIQPQTTSTYTLGNSSKVWLTSHINTINAFDYKLCTSALANCWDIEQSATNVVHFTNASGTDWMVFGDAGTPNVTVGPALFIPLTTNNTDLGSSSRTFKSLFLSGAVTVSGLSGQSTSITVQHFPTGACTLGFTSGILTTATGSC